MKQISNTFDLKVHFWSLVGQNLHLV